MNARALLFAAAALSLTGRGAAGAAPEPPEIVARAAAVYTTSLQGVIGMDRHFSTLIHGGPVRHSETSESAYLMSDGAYAAIKYYAISDDGKAFDRGKIGGRESQTNKDWKAGKIFFKEPYDRRFLADYTYSEQSPCTTCASGETAVEFSSAIRDAQHGKGTMWLDAQAHVVKLTYFPNLMPPHASTGSVTETSSEVLPGIWYVTRIDQTYSGHALFISGTGTFTGTFDNFHHYSSVADGVAAMEKRYAAVEP
jgi:hypothetical protein